MIDLHKYESKLFTTAEQLRNSMSMPIPIRQICRELGVVSVCRSRIQSAPAILVDAASKPKVLLYTSALGAGTGHEAFTSWERFAIAHELGHLVLYRAKGPIPAGPSEYWQIEALCDAFARRLLVSDAEVRTARESVADTAVQRMQLSSRIALRARIPWSAAAHRVGEIVGTLSDGTAVSSCATMIPGTSQEQLAGKRQPTQFGRARHSNFNTIEVSYRADVFIQSSRLW